MRRRAGSAMLFMAAAALAAWWAWPGSPGGFAAAVGRVDVIAIVVLLGGLPLVTRRVLGPPGGGRVARFLRVGTYAAILALIPAKNVVEQVLDVPPRGGTGLRLYRLISGEGFGNQWSNEIVFLVVMALYVAAIVWMTSRRSLVAPATLAIGTVAGTALGVVMYAIGPLGFGGGPTTNPWLPRSDIALFMVLAWSLLFGAPVAAAVVADRRYTTSRSSVPSVPPGGARARQIVAAGLLTNLLGALFVTVSGTATIAAMLKVAWLRNWLYHGQHLLFGVGGLRLLLRGDPGAVTYSHQITAAVDAPPYLIICIAFPLIALALTGLAALFLWGGAAANRGDPRRGGGSGPPGPGPTPDPPDGGELVGVTEDEAGSAAGRISPPAGRP